MRWIHDFQLFLFDFDGLLVDTERLHYQAYINALHRRGYELDWNFPYYCSLAHLNATAIREAIYEKFPDLDVEWNILYEEKKKNYLSLLASGSIRLMPGVAPLLNALAEANIRRCVATHSLLDQTLLVRSQLPILNTIPTWITREDYEKPKPDPECYLRAIAMCGKTGDRIIGFEDSVRGLKALQGTPALPVLICANHHPLLEMASEGAAVHYESFEQIPEETLI